MSREKLLPPNHTREEAAFVKVSERVKELPAEKIKCAFYPENAPDELLPYLAWALGVPEEVWKLTDTREEKIRLVREAIELHRHKGTLYAVKKCLEVLGFEGEIKEWFQYGGEPYHFKINVDVNRTLSGDVFLSKENEERLLHLVEEYKNVRSHLEEFSVRVRFDKEIAVAGTIKCISAARLTFEELPFKEIFIERNIGVAPSFKNIGVLIVGEI